MNLLDAIYNTLKSDSKYMSMLGLSPTSPGTEITKRIIRGMEPDTALHEGLMPLVLIYTKPGRFGGNYLVYEGKFCLEHYAKTAYDARLLAERAFKLLHGQRIKMEGFQPFTPYLAFDSDLATGIRNVKCYQSIFDVDYVRR